MAGSKKSEALNKSRTQILKEQVDAAEHSKDRSTYDVPFKGKQTPFTRIRVRTDFPLYRIQSGRTHRAQAAYLEAHKDLPKTFFDDPEDPKVQKAQHGMLLKMIKEKGLDKDLQDRKQQSAIVLTGDGFIVDGNRRIAALRDAGEEYVTAVVLPESATKQEIYETELELQMAQDTKADYNWVDELVHIRLGKDELGESLDVIAKRMRRDKGEIVDAIARLQMVDLYLAWLGTPGLYNKVPDDGKGSSMAQAFTDLTTKMNGKAIKRLPSTAQVTIRDMCFAAIRRQEGYKTIRNIINHMTSQPDLVLEKLKEDPEAAPFIMQPPKQREKAKEAESTDDPLKELAETEEKSTPESFLVLGPTFAKPSLAEKVTPVLVRITSDMEDEDKDGKRQSNPLQTILKAEALLQKVELSPETDSIPDIAKALSKVDEQVARISKDIARLKKEKR